MRQKTQRALRAALLGLTLALGASGATGAAQTTTVACGLGSCGGGGGR